MHWRAEWFHCGHLHQTWIQQAGYRSSFLWYITQHRLVITDVSEQPIFPIFKGQALQGDCLTLENRNDRLPQKSLTTNLRCITSQEIPFTRPRKPEIKQDAVSSVKKTLVSAQVSWHVLKRNRRGLPRICLFVSYKPIRLQADVICLRG